MVWFVVIGLGIDSDQVTFLAAPANEISYLVQLPTQVLILVLSALFLVLILVH